MKKILYLNSIAGIAGDMFAAAFLDAGLVSPQELQNLCHQLGVPHVNIVISKVIRTHMQATHVDVSENALQAHPSQTHTHVHYRELEQQIIRSSLSEETKNGACKILDCLAEAEAHCHGVNKADVVFHELGMIDSLLDIVMAAYCISTVAPDVIVASPVKLGRGVVKTAHGILPIPPPVSAALSVGMSTSVIPQAIQKNDIELSTPTGLAILKALQPIFSQDWPQGKIISQGYGAGSMDLDDYPNLFQICLLETQEAVYSHHTLPYAHDSVIEIVANYDDVSPEHLAWAMEKLFGYGALDVWQTTAVGKKGRVMIILSALIPLEHWQACADFILKKTPTFGLRYTCLERLKLERFFETRTTDKGSFQVKVGCDKQGKKIKEKFEFEDVRRVWDNELNH